MFYSYQRRKREGKIVKAPISQLPTTEQEKVRQHWKQYQRRHRERKRAMEEMVTAHIGLPAEFQHSSPNTDRLLPHNTISYASILQWSAGTQSGARDDDLNGKFVFAWNARLAVGGRGSSGEGWEDWRDLHAAFEKEEWPQPCGHHFYNRCVQDQDMSSEFQALKADSCRRADCFTRHAWNRKRALSLLDWQIMWLQCC